METKKSNPAPSDNLRNKKDHMYTYCEPVPQTIQVEQVLGANMAQRVLEVDMMVPEKKPNIEQIIDVYVKNVEILSIDVLRDQVIIRGSLEVKVMYVADLPNQPVHAFEKKNVRFTRDIEILGTEPGMTVNADATVELVDYAKEYDPCNVHVTIVLKIWARVIDTIDMQVYPQEVAPSTHEYGGYETKGAIVMAVEEQTAEHYAEEGAGIIEQPSEMLIETPIETPVETPLEEIPQIEIPEEVPEEVSEEISGAIMKVKGRSVNVRSGPGTNFPVVSKVDRGDIVRIRDQAFGWYKVTLADGMTTGWIASWLLTAPKG